MCAQYIGGVKDTESTDIAKQLGAQFVVRQMEKKDLPQLAQLQQRAFKKEGSLNKLVKLFEWKYFANPLGKANAIVIEGEDSRIVAVFASIPSAIKIDQTKQLVQLVVSMAVDPDYQKKGLLSLLWKAHESLIKQKYVKSIVCGFPNSLALIIGRKYFSSRTITTFPVYHIPLSRFGPIRRGASKSYLGGVVDLLLRVVHRIVPLRICYSGSNPDQKLVVQRLQSLPDDYDYFWEKTSQQYQNCIFRDRLYLQWRIFDEPSGISHFYEVRQEGMLIGYFAFQLGRDIKIIDYFAYRDHGLIEGVISEMIKTASELKGARYITFPLFDRSLDILFAKYRPLLGDAPTLVYSDYSNESTNDVVEQIRMHGWFLGGSDFWLG